MMQPPTLVYSVACPDLAHHTRALGIPAGAAVGRTPLFSSLTKVHQSRWLCRREACALVTRHCPRAIGTSSYEAEDSIARIMAVPRRHRPRGRQPRSQPDAVDGLGQQCGARPGGHCPPVGGDVDRPQALLQFTLKVAVGLTCESRQSASSRVRRTFSVTGTYSQARRAKRRGYATRCQ
jgi:hypothetical protein